MAKECPNCGRKNKDNDKEVVVAVFQDSYDVPGISPIVHTFCNMTCYSRWSSNSNFQEYNSLRRKDKLKNINYDEIYDEF
jgi:hypothetical protein